MWKATVLVALAAFCLVEGCIYKDRECPDYTVVEEHADYEVRSYPALTWATTTETSRYRRVGQYNAFMRLFRYISGQNDREQKINMTVPVLTQMTASGDETVYKMSFMVPSQFADNTPVPTDELVQIVKEHPTQYAVRSFGGYIVRQKYWEDQAEKLAESVKDDDTVIKTAYYQVGYDAPFDLFNRRNEVWMVKKVNEV